MVTSMRTTITTMEQLKDTPGQFFTTGLPEMLEKLESLGIYITHSSESREQFIEQASWYNNFVLEYSW